MIPLPLEEFEGPTLKREEDLPVIFYARWCGFCRRFTPEFENFFRGLGVEYGMADISDYDDPRWDTFGIDVVPTIITFEGGKESHRRDGLLGLGLQTKDLEATRKHLAV